MKLLQILLEEVPEQFENQVAPTAAGINKVIESIDPDMHYGVFAKAVAKVLKDEYGSHNIQPFMEVLHAELGINEAATEEVKAMLSSLTYDQVAKTLGGDSFNAPNSDDSSTKIFDDRDWTRWKEFMMKKWGDIEIALDPTAPYWGKVKILDPAFNKRKDDYSKAKGAWLDKERQAGRTSGLD